jgi:hypothetical protein
MGMFMITLYRKRFIKTLFQLKIAFVGFIAVVGFIPLLALALHPYPRTSWVVWMFA